MKWIVLSVLLLSGGCKVSCFGDSNTASSYGADTPIRKWVQLLDAELPVGWAAIEHGVPSRALVDVDTVDGLAELDAHIAADQPIAVVLAYGSVDALAIAYQLETYDEAMTALTDIMDHIHAVHPIITIYVALVPFTFRNIFWTPAAVVAEFNRQVLGLVASDRIIDFATISASEDSWDGLHFCGDPFIAPCTSAHGQQIRADIAKAVIHP